MSLILYSQMLAQSGVMAEVASLASVAGHSQPAMPADMQEVMEPKPFMSELLNISHIISYTISYHI